MTQTDLTWWRWPQLSERVRSELLKAPVLEMAASGPAPLVAIADTGQALRSVPRAISESLRDLYGREEILPTGDGSWARIWFRQLGVVL